MSSTMLKIQLQMYQRSQRGKNRSCKLLEENIGSTLQKTGVEKDSLDRTPFTWKLRPTSEKMGLHEYRME